MDLGFVDICPLNPVEIVMELVLQEVDLIVAWAYKVPGFRELERDDQASLVSSGIFGILSYEYMKECVLKSSLRCHHKFLFPFEWINPLLILRLKSMDDIRWKLLNHTRLLNLEGILSCVCDHLNGSYWAVIACVNKILHVREWTFRRSYGAVLSCAWYYSLINIFQNESLLFLFNII